MKYFGFVLLTLISFFTPAAAAEYVFSATEDAFYENPANWSPAYPGDTLRAGDRAVLLSHGAFGGRRLVIQGVLEIASGVTFHMPGGMLQIEAGALLDNHGTLLADQVSNAGRLFNRMASAASLKSYEARSGAYTLNSRGASFQSAASLINGGRFDNYGSCLAALDFDNRSEFNGIRFSRLEISRDLVLSPRSVLAIAPDAQVRIRGAEPALPLIP
ncbi:MAG: hypothetical protein NW241_06040 [Bacteroidia bacterium]|nr:hypothetical protein [Bacteroidia bacterium]